MPPTPQRSFAVPRPGRRLAIAIGALVVLTLLPTASAIAASPDRAPELLPTIQYEEAVAHADDDITFAPGGRVTVPFRPRATDRWKVDGKAPRALSAGRASGREMREEASDPSASRGAPVAVPAAWSSDGDAVAGDIELTAAVDPGGLRREVFGFLPYWELGASTTRLDWEKISTVAFFGVGAAADGTLQKRNADGSTTVGWSGWTSAAMTSVINAAHTSGARAVLTVQSFGWSTSGLERQKQLLGSSTARATLAAEIVKAVVDRGADGVNLDFEPLASGYAEEFTSLVRKIRSSFNAVAPGYQITFDTTGWIGNYPIEDATAPGGADAIMIMGYDYRSSGSATAGSVAPLRSSTAYDITDTVSAYLARVPASKLILGVPYYGRAWSTDTDQLNAKNISGGKEAASSTAVYTTARELAAEHGRRYDTNEAVAWAAYRRETCTDAYGCVTHWRQLYYDDATSLKAKYDLVNKHDLRGVGIWALGYDGTRTELYAALKEKFIADKEPPTITGSSLSSKVISPNGDGLFESTTMRVTADAFVKWGYDVQPVTGDTLGAKVRSGTVANTTPTFTWNGKSSAGKVVADGAYRIRLWLADASDNRASISYTVRVDTKPPRITSSMTYGFFSPDGNGHNDTTRLAWTSSQDLHGTVRIFDPGGTSIKLWKFSSGTSWSTVWDGRNDAGDVVPDGRYRYRVYGRDPAGNRTIVYKDLLVDRTIEVHKWSPRAFQPSAGERSRLTLDLRRKATVTAAIYLGGTKVRTIWSGKALAAGVHGWLWDGTKADGTAAKPGTYSMVVNATSTHGTTRWTTSVTVKAP